DGLAAAGRGQHARGHAEHEDPGPGPPLLHGLHLPFGECFTKQYTPGERRAMVTLTKYGSHRAHPHGRSVWTVGFTTLGYRSVFRLRSGARRGTHPTRSPCRPE